MNGCLVYSIILTLVGLFWEDVNGIDLTVTTTNGPVRGTTRHALGSNRPVYSFFGIPYARPPDYAFRFHFPVDPWGWKEVKNVTDDRVPFCYQDRLLLKKILNNAVFGGFVDENHPMSEDCLNLNVFTSSIPTKDANAKKLLPVIVWIHGGSMQTTVTTPKMWMLSAYEDVVLVTIQYRLGVFGFLSFEEEIAPPNAGLKDQTKALEWVRDNIRNFGGNPDLVTIFGLSAGGFAASAHLVSPLSKGLFRRVIAGSGVFLKPKPWQKNPREEAFKIARSTNCYFADVGPAVTCLRNRVTSSELVDAARNNNIMFNMAEDRLTFPAESLDLIHNGSVDTSVSLMVGVVEGEYDYALARKFIPNEFFGPQMNRSIAESLIRSSLDQHFPDDFKTPDDYNNFLSLYLSNSATWDDLVFGVVEFMGDLWFNSNVDLFASSYKSAGGSVYSYLFAPKPSFYKNKKFNLRRPLNIDRADHGDDMPFLFGFPFLAEFEKKGMTFTNEEKILSKKMMKMLSSFAATGKPTPDGSVNTLEYPSYLDINKEISLQGNYREKQLSLWRRFYEKHRRSHKFESLNNNNIAEKNNL